MSKNNGNKFLRHYLSIIQNMYESHQIAVDCCKKYYLINDLTNIE